MKFWIILLLFLSSINAFSEKKGKVIYKYKKYQKFDFEDLVVEGEGGAPGDISITSRFQKRFDNKLPYRRNFNPEMVKSIEGLK